ncbi:MAG: tRNA lysidine(34) synthetase TilS [bacterium]|nr:tRNA lysidine(34) synthetase TilS [bacterium]
MNPSFPYAFRTRAIETIERFSMLRRGSRPLLAVSGGPDSCVLLDVIARMQDEWNLDLHLCHVNHGLRGAASNEDERFVIQLAHQYHLPLTVRRFEPDEIERIRTGNLEDEARRLRYEKLRHTAEELNLSPILTGHTLSDQAETVLLRMIRSSGLTGLSGVLPVKFEREAAIARPLLAHTREEVLRYAREEAIAYRHDEMNDDSTFWRVRVRNELIPFLKDSFNPNLESALGRLADLAREEENFWEQHTACLADSVGLATPDASADCELFSALSRAEQRRLIRHYVKAFDPSPAMPAIDAAIALIAGERPQGEIHIDQNLRVYRRYDRFYIASPHGLGAPVPETELAVPGSTPAPELGVEAIIDLFPASVERLPVRDEWCAEFDADKAFTPITIRGRRDGDAIAPVGMEGRKKIKKLLQERRIILEERDRTPIVLFNGELAWAAGVCLSKLFQVDEQTRTVLRISLNRIAPMPQHGNQ